MSQSTIPIDEDGNTKDKLADHWEELMLLHPHCPDSIDSIEQIIRTEDYDWYIDGVLPCEPGDYLNIFEEYRGFYCRDVHTRTCPWEKDFLIYSSLDSSAVDTIWQDWVTGHEIGHQVNIIWHNPDTNSVMHADPYRWNNIPNQYLEDDTVLYNVKDPRE